MKRRPQAPLEKITLCSVTISRLVSVAANNTQQCEQVGEDVIHIQVDSQGSHDVVCLTAVDDTLYIHQDKS